MAYRDKEEQARYQREWYQKNKALHLKRQQNARRVRQDAIDAEKVRRGCARCGYNENPIALDVHHADGDKQFGIAKAAKDKRSIEVILAEMARCEILCAICHRIEHKTKRQAGIVLAA